MSGKNELDQLHKSNTLPLSVRLHDTIPALAPFALRVDLREIKFSSSTLSDHFVRTSSISSRLQKCHEWESGLTRKVSKAFEFNTAKQTPQPELTRVDDGRRASSACLSATITMPVSTWPHTEVDRVNTTPGQANQSVATRS